MSSHSGGIGYGRATLTEEGRRQAAARTGSAAQGKIPARKGRPRHDGGVLSASSLSEHLASHRRGKRGHARVLVATGTREIAGRQQPQGSAAHVIGVVPRSTRRRPRRSHTTRGRCPESAARSSSTDIQRGPEGRPARREHSLVEPERAASPSRERKQAPGATTPATLPSTNRWAIVGTSWRRLPYPGAKGVGTFLQWSGGASRPTPAQRGCRPLRS